GEYPFKEQSINKFQLKNYSHMQYISVRQYRPDLPTWVDSALKKACAPNPSKRYQLLSEFLHDLRTPKECQYEEAFKPLMERNPLLFWKATALLALVANIGLLVYFFK
nr:bifunctional protein-serine/threonine kinase/phosphatase [Thiomicrorhabdus sp.]